MTTEVFCPRCEDYRKVEVVERDETYTVRAREITVPVKADVCNACGEILGSEEKDEEILAAVYSEYRRQVGLLTPGQIKEIRKRYQLSQKSFAALLGMSQATINRYEQGALQEQAHDTAIRACEDSEFVRRLLQRAGDRLTEWQRRRVVHALDKRPPEETEAQDNLEEFAWMLMPREVSDKTGFRRFDYRRLAAVAVWYCNHLSRVTRTTINKLLFYADFLNFKRATVSLTGAAYRKLPYGPTLADYDGFLSLMESEGLIVSEESEYPGGYVELRYEAGPAAESLSVKLSPDELQVMECVASAIGRMSAGAISERSHQEPAWRETEDGQLISYLKAASLSLSLPT